MTKRSRTVLFLVLAFVFLLTAPLTVLFTQGYRFDWETKQIAQVGAFYFKVHPLRAEVHIDEKHTESTDILFGSVLTKKFIPRSYKVQIIKDGYHTWEKTLQIVPKQVTEAKNITLFPQDVQFQTLVADVEHIWRAPNQNEAILKKAVKNEWVLSLWDFARNAEYELLRIRKSSSDITSIEWASDASKIIIELTDREEARHIIQVLDRAALASQSFPIENPKTTTLDFLGKNIEQISFSGLSENQLILTKLLHNSPVLFLADYESKELLAPLARNITSFTIHEPDIFWLDDQGILWQKDGLSSTPAEALNATPFPIQLELQQQILFFGNQIYIKQEKKLYRLDANKQNFQLISSSAKNPILSPDKRKIALSNDSEISIFFLEDQPEQPKRAKGDQIFLTRFSQTIENLSWVNNHYVIFSFGNTIKILEIDDRDRLNIIDIAQFPDSSITAKSSPLFFWEANSGILYMKADDRIQASQKLLP